MRPDRIDTGHPLPALLDDPDGMAHEVLRALDVSTVTLRIAVLTGVTPE